MSNAYIDTSLLIAIEICEPNFELYEEELTRFDRIFSSNLLEAEYRSVCRRLRRDSSDLRLSKVTWIIPEYPLTQELRTVLAAGYLRGADLWHVASAIYAEKEQKTKMSFLTLDMRQQKVADAVGFDVRSEIFGTVRD